jgi:hypothetical protein
MSAKDIPCVPEGRSPLWSNENPESLLLTQIWYDFFPELSWHTKKISRNMIAKLTNGLEAFHVPAKQSPLRSITALL